MRCNLTTCRFNAKGKCTDREHRKECLDVCEKVLGDKYTAFLEREQLEGDDLR